MFLVRGAPDTEAAQLWIAVLATGGALGFATAAHLWGTADRDSQIHVVVAPERKGASIDGVVIHRVFVPQSAITVCDGLPITRKPWTVLDHLSTLRRGPAQQFADRALQREWITRDDIARRLVDYPHRQGNGTLRHVYAASSDRAAAESERRLHRILRRTGLDGWVANYRLWQDGRLVAVLDVAFPAYRLAIEIDGWAYHSDVERFQRDRARQNALVSLGWTVLRFTWADLNARPELVAATVRVNCGPQ